MRNRIKAFFVALAVLIGGAGLASCGIGDEYASSTSDTHACVFDGSERGGQKLKFQIPPGAESKKIDDNDQVVKIPTSNRFWMVSPNRNVADPGTPEYYRGNASGGVPVVIEGQIRFRFNPELACEWYSKHGRRNADENGDLGFNVRGDANGGWFHYGNENFVVTMQEVVGENLSTYDWAYLHYNYPVNADEAGIVPTGEQAGEATRLMLGEDLGEKYTDRLYEYIGDEYFCGIEVVEDDPCPPMSFQVVYAGPGNDSSLVKNREQVEQTKQELETARLKGELSSKQQESLLAAEKAEQALLVEQAKTAALRAQIETAKCAIYAQYGLDCEGHHPTVIFPDQR